jgi:hypothetical protein
MAHVYSDSKHFQREEKVNLGIGIICSTYFFGQGLKDYRDGKPMADFSDKQAGKIQAQTAYELGRLLGAWMVGCAMTIPTKVVVKGAKYLETTSEVRSLAMKARRSKSNPFC